MLEWILDRCAGRAEAQETAIGWLPRPEDLDLKGLDISASAIGELTSVDKAAWLREVAGFKEYLQEFGSHTPQALYSELADVTARLS